MIIISEVALHFRAGSVCARFVMLHCWIFPHNGSEQIGGVRAGARPQVHFSKRRQSCLILSSHGNQQLWCTWPTYVLYVHKHVLTICYCRCVQQLAGTWSGCWVSLSDKTNRGVKSCFHSFWEAVTESSQQRLCHFDTCSYSVFTIETGNSIISIMLTYNVWQDGNTCNYKCITVGSDEKNWI